MTAAATWWLAVVLGGPIRPTGACLLARDPHTDHATVRSALRLDSIGSEDDQAAALGDQVAALAEDNPLVVILARAAGVGRDLETIWNDAMPRRSAVRSHPLPTGDTTSTPPSREHLVTALHLAISRDQLTAPDDLGASLGVYIAQQPPSYSTAHDPHDADPDGTAVPTALAVYYSDRQRHMTIHAATKARIPREPPGFRAARYNATYSGMIGDLGALVGDAERRAGIRRDGPPRISRNYMRPPQWRSPWW